MNLQGSNIFLDQDYSSTSKALKSNKSPDFSPAISPPQEMKKQENFARREITQFQQRHLQTFESRLAITQHVVAGNSGLFAHLKS